MNIKEVAARAGLPAKTIRYYEEIGLIRPLRAANGYRSFRESDLHKLAFLARAGLAFPSRIAARFWRFMRTVRGPAAMSRRWPKAIWRGLPKRSRNCAGWRQRWAHWCGPARATRGPIARS